jgi:hypothetical protein
MPRARNGRVSRNVVRNNKVMPSRLTMKTVMQEISGTPTVTAASFDPPPVSTSKSKYITRKVRVTKALTSGAATITVDDVKAESSTGAFKVMGVSAWGVGCASGQFTLGDGVWDNDLSTTMKYTDIAPLTRLCGAKFNIPDNIASFLNTGTTPVMSFATSGPAQTGAQLVADITIRYQI